jgi:hypothetical protein
VSPRDQIARLEGLLQRVRTNAAKARPAADRRAAAPDVATPVPPKVQVIPPAVVPPFPLAPVTPAAPLVVAAPPSPPPIAAVPPVEVPSWRPEPGSSVQSRPSSAPPEELSDDDLLEVTTIPPAPAALAEEPAQELSIDVDVSMDEEEPPASSSRSISAATMDETLEGATETDEERDVPVKTPPPESGPQAAGPPSMALDEPGVPDVDALEADMMAPPSMGPTAEQLGETIELEAPRGPTLEIDVSVSDVPGPEPERPPEELEVSLPRGQMPSGLYDVPPGQETPPAPAVEERTSSAPPEPRPTARPELGAAEIARVVLGNRPSVSNTFVDVLDRSLAL